MKSSFKSNLVFLLLVQGETTIFFKANLVLPFHQGQGFNELSKVLGTILSKSLSQVIYSDSSLFF